MMNKTKAALCWDLFLREETGKQAADSVRPSGGAAASREKAVVSARTAVGGGGLSEHIVLREAGCVCAEATESEGALRVRRGSSVGRMSSRNRKEPCKVSGVGSLKLALVLLGLEDTGGSLDLTPRACLTEGIFQDGPEKPHRFPFEERG